MHKIIKTLAAIGPFLSTKVALATDDVPLGVGGATEALDTVETGMAGSGVTESSLPELVGGIINVALGLLGIILVIYIVYGGFIYMTAGGDKEKITTAKKVMTNAIVGIIIVVAAYAISSYVISALVTAAGG